MSEQKSGKVLNFLELCGVILLFIFALGFALPDFLSGLVNAASYGILILLILRRWKNFAYTLTKDKLLLLLVGFVVISVFWSEDVSNTIDKARGMLRTTAFGAYVAMRYTSREQMRLLFWILLLGTVSSLVVGILLPSYGTHIINNSLAWRGVFGHKQMLGRIMGFTAAFFLVTTIDRYFNRWAALASLICTLFLLKLSISATGWIVFLFSLSCLPVYKIVKQRRYRAFFLAGALLLCSIVTITVAVNLEAIVVDGFGKDLEFNGRTPIWTLAIQKGLERPFLGYGYHGFWSSDAGNFIIRRTWLGAASENIVDEGLENIASGEKAGLSHNGFLDLFLQIGFLGLILFVLNLVMLLTRVFILMLSTRKIEYFWMFVFLITKLVANASDSPTIAEPNNLYWTIYVTVALTSALELSRLRRQQMKDSISSLEVTA